MSATPKTALIGIVVALIIGIIIGYGVGLFTVAPVTKTVTATTTVVSTTTVAPATATVTKTITVEKTVTVTKTISPTPTPAKKVTLSLEYGQPWEKAVTWAIEKFKSAMAAKGIKVELKLMMIPYGADIVGKESTDFAAGTAGDVVLVDSFMIPEYAAARYLLPLDDFVGAWEDWKYFPEPMKKIVSFKGKVYGVMMDTDVRMIWYRKDIFAIAGLPEDWQPKTWKDIFDAALKLKEKEDVIKSKLGIKEFYPFYIPAGTKWGEGTTMQGFYMVLLGADKPPYNRLYDYKTGKWIGKSTALYRAFKFYYDIYVKYKVGPVEYNFAPDVWATHRKVFAEGKVAMDVGGSWEWGEGWGPKGIAPIPDEEKKVGFAKMPGWSGGAHGEPELVTISGGWAWVINAKIPEEKKAVAWEFIKTVCSKEIIAKYCAEFGKVAPRSDAKDVSEYAKNPYLVKILEYLKFTDFRDAMPGYSKVSYFVQKVTEDIITKGITPDKALEEYYNLLVKEFGKDKVIEYPVKTE
mgnify:CR=1 FL=1